MRPYRVDRLAIKPTLACTANCVGCASRRELHRSLSTEKALSLEQWERVLKDASEIGLRSLHISGGEPTLYSELINLIKAGKNLGLYVRMNSNGSMITEEYAKSLLGAGLDEICVSIYSHRPEVHNSFCRSRSLWESATRAVRIFSDLMDIYPGFFLGTMSIILRENYQDFAELLEFHHSLGSMQLGVSYLEGDFCGDFLLNREEIIEFRDQVVPGLIEYCRSLDPRVTRRAQNVVRGLFSGSGKRIADFAEGRYWDAGYCDVPKTAGLIMASGDVHPCNIVEYTHEPVMGNLFHNSFKEIWVSERWNTYRRELHQKCSFCPVNIYAPIPLAPAPDASRLVTFYHSKAFSPLRPAVGRVRVFTKKQRHRLGI